MDFYYIVIQGDHGGIFVGTNFTLTEDFDQVCKFLSEQDAADYIARDHIHDRTKILRYSE